MTAELQAILDLNKSLAASTSAISVQMIEVQALVNTLLDLERERLVKETGQTAQTIAQLVEARFQAHRKAVFDVVSARMYLANPDIDLGPGN